MHDGINKVILIGYLGHDPELKSDAKENTHTLISLATNKTLTDKHTGEQKIITQWHQICFFGQLGEVANNLLSKGSHIYVEGYLSTRSWQNSDGQKCHSTNIVGQRLTLLNPIK